MTGIQAHGRPISTSTRRPVVQRTSTLSAAIYFPLKHENYNPHPIKIYKGHAANRRSGVPNYQVTLVSLHRPTPFQYRDFNSTEMRFTSRYPGPKRGPPGHCRSTNRKPTSMNGDGYRFTLSGGEFDWTHG